MPRGVKSKLYHYRKAERLALRRWVSGLASLIPMTEAMTSPAGKRDRIAEIADELMLARVAHLNESGHAVVWHNNEVERILLEELRELLEAARAIWKNGPDPDLRWLRIGFARPFHFRRLGAPRPGFPI